jgi:hypothetical protein
MNQGIVGQFRGIERGYMKPLGISHFEERLGLKDEDAGDYLQKGVVLMRNVHEVYKVDEGDCLENGKGIDFVAEEEDDSHEDGK